ncbi:MAG TPA: trypsin-like peptidase domain-containing protein [Ktedonobacteraceae bacterium]|nr:trypsin-like peptidase domain-containing protein [Ktedonobacteraceae bacterium]
MTTTETGTGAEAGQPQGLSLLALNNAFSSDLGEMIEQAQASVVQVRRGDRGAGTGVIWQANGGIITNHHVITHTGSKTLVELRDGQVLEAQIIDSDPMLDVALLKVPANHLAAIPVADSSRLRVGELVFAIGHPWGQRGVVTAGIVSALSKVQVRNSNRQLEYIKSDVRLAPGNSGGPLLNAQGHVIGINAMIMGGDLSVAIPSNTVSNWMAQLPQTRITLGVQIQLIELPSNVRMELAKGQSLGLLVVGIIAGGLAEQANLLVGDVLIDIENKALSDAAMLRAILAQSTSKDSVQLRVLRGGKIEKTEVLLHPREQAA